MCFFRQGSAEQAVSIQRDTKHTQETNTAAGEPTKNKEGRKQEDVAHGEGWLCLPLLHTHTHTYTDGYTHPAQLTVLVCVHVNVCPLKRGGQNGGF